MVTFTAIFAKNTSNVYSYLHDKLLNTLCIELKKLQKLCFDFLQPESIHVSLSNSYNIINDQLSDTLILEMYINNLFTIYTYASNL